jgi:hypothetical protein
MHGYYNKEKESSPTRIDFKTPATMLRQELDILLQIYMDI